MKSSFSRNSFWWFIQSLCLFLANISIHKLRRYWLLLDNVLFLFVFTYPEGINGNPYCVLGKKLHRIWVQVLAIWMCAFLACMLVFKECEGIGALEQVLSPWAYFPHLEIRSLNKFLWHKFHDSLWEISLSLSVWELLYMSPLSRNEKMHWKLLKTAAIENSHYNSWSLSVRKLQVPKEILMNSDLCQEALNKSMYYWSTCCHESIFLSFSIPNCEWHAQPKPAQHLSSSSEK